MEELAVEWAMRACRWCRLVRYQARFREAGYTICRKGPEGSGVFRGGGVKQAWGDEW